MVKIIVRPHKKLSEVAFFVLVALIVLSCAGQSTRVVLDAKGNSVTIPTEIHRVATGGAMNQIVLMLGGADRIVATAESIKKNPMFVKIYPRIMSVPAPFGLSTPDANIEELLSTKPDVIFGSPEQYRYTGIPVVEIDMTNSEGIKQTILAISRVLGTDAQTRAAKFVAYYDGNVARVKKGAENVPFDKRLRVYTAGGKEGLSTDGRNTIASCWIENAGGINLAAQDFDGLNKVVSIEKVIYWDPEVIFTNVATRDLILKDSRWSHNTAVRTGRIYVSPKGVYLWSVRSGEGALMYLFAAKMLYPHIFKDIDLAADIRFFYKNFYNYTPSDAEIYEILNPKE